MPFDARNVPTTNNKEVMRQRFNEAVDFLYEHMKNGPACQEGCAVGLVNLSLADGRSAQFKLVLTTDEEEWCGE